MARLRLAVTCALALATCLALARGSRTPNGAELDPDFHNPATDASGEGDLVHGTTVPAAQLLDNNAKPALTPRDAQVLKLAQAAIIADELEHEAEERAAAAAGGAEPQMGGGTESGAAGPGGNPPLDETAPVDPSLVRATDVVPESQSNEPTRVVVDDTVTPAPPPQGGAEEASESGADAESDAKTQARARAKTIADAIAAAAAADDSLTNESDLINALARATGSIVAGVSDELEDMRNTNNVGRLGTPGGEAPEQANSGDEAAGRTTATLEATPATPLQTWGSQDPRIPSYLLNQLSRLSNPGSVAVLRGRPIVLQTPTGEAIQLIPINEDEDNGGANAGANGGGDDADEQERRLQQLQQQADELETAQTESKDELYRQLVARQKLYQEANEAARNLERGVRDPVIAMMNALAQQHGQAMRDDAEEELSAALRDAARLAAETDEEMEQADKEVESSVKAEAEADGVLSTLPKVPLSYESAKAQLAQRRESMPATPTEQLPVYARAELPEPNHESYRYVLLGVFVVAAGMICTGSLVALILFSARYPAASLSRSAPITNRADDLAA
jgi:hypothetical protein